MINLVSVPKPHLYLKNRILDLPLVQLCDGKRVGTSLLVHQVLCHELSDLGSCSGIILVNWYAQQSGTVFRTQILQGIVDLAPLLSLLVCCLDPSIKGPE